MTRILLLSDTHGYIDNRILSYMEDVDEVWHAGDIGNWEVVEGIRSVKPLRAVFGNIDSADFYREFPLDLRFKCENVSVWMTHIGGYPGKYKPRIKTELEQHPCKLFICGHSHILKVMPDRKNNLLHMNPGAAGKSGFHQIRTLLRFSIQDDEIKDLEVVELGKRV